jgi:hypothetical protein
VAFLPFGAARPNRDLHAAYIQLNGVGSLPGRQQGPHRCRDAPRPSCRCCMTCNNFNGHYYVTRGFNQFYSTFQHSKNIFGVCLFSKQLELYSSEHDIQKMTVLKCNLAVFGKKIM